jgi:ribokinase
VTGCDVVVVGSFMTDLVVQAPRRPAAGETIVGTSLEEFLGGKGCNQAVAAARAGASTAMVGRVGDDERGRAFLALLGREGIDASAVSVDTTVGTGVAVPLVEPSGANSIVILPQANAAIGPADLDAAGPLLRRARVVLLQLELPVDVVVTAARLAQAGGATVVLNPAPVPESGDLSAFAGLVDVIVPNEVEAAALTGLDDPLAAAKELQARFGCAVVVTLGGEGSLVLDRDGDHHRLAAHPVPAVDTVGAGDAYCGALGARLAAGDDLLTAARHGGAAGSLSVTRNGAEPSLPTAAEVDALLSG